MSALPSIAVRNDLVLEIRFERENPRASGEKRTGRFYELRVRESTQLTLDGVPAGFDLVVKRGSLAGKRSVLRTESFTTLRSAIERFGHLATERRQHGYSEVP